MERWELWAENAKKTQKLEKLKRKLLKIVKRCDIFRVVPCDCERTHPEHFESVVVFEILRFKTIVIGPQSNVKFPPKISGTGYVTKK